MGVSRPHTLQVMGWLFVAAVGSVMVRILSGKQWEDLKSILWPEQDFLKVVREIRLHAKELATSSQDSMKFADFAHGRVKSVKL